jgi:hypothetical protein
MDASSPLPVLSSLFYLLGLLKQMPSSSPEAAAFWRQVGKINLWIQTQGRSVALGAGKQVCSSGSFLEKAVFAGPPSPFVRLDVSLERSLILRIHFHTSDREPGLRGNSWCSIIPSVLIY